ncbi:MAG TPA: putative baseplate assembly protein [Actinomycetota bacterium]|nr:putative baseplate assembly protein [Actinomycetota bacterium]
MTLPAPNLDDRRFQELVDEAKRMVQRRCPEWTDHNVSDPGVTLIETFAYMVDQLIYRVNRVPDRMYIKFLDLLGVQMFPPTAANTDVTFWLSAPQAVDVTIPPGTSVATVRTETEEAVSFSVTRELVIPPVQVARLATSTSDSVIRDHTDRFSLGVGFDAFGENPRPGDAMCLGLSRTSPSCVLLIRFDCEVRGLGIDPTQPPIRWETWSGTDWLRCEVLKDGTGGLNRPGDVLLHLPQTQVLSTIGGHSAAWLRCRIIEAPGEPGYSASPRIRKLVVASMGGTTRATNAESVENEILGVSEGVPGQRFALRRAPVVPFEEPAVLDVSGPDGWEPWTEVTSFATSRPDDRHFLLEASTGHVVLGPAVRERDGTLRQFGAIPVTGSALRLRSYRTGGGRKGNVAAGAISVLKTSIPFIARVENRTLGTGGVDGEDIESVKVRGPLLLRSRDRAVTPEDFEYLVREVAPEIARVRCLPAGGRNPAGAVRVLVVPGVQTDNVLDLTQAQLIPPAETMQRIQQYLERRRIIGVRVVIEPPQYRGITVVARLRSSWRASPEEVKSAATEALHRYLHPIIGGPDGTGWIFGRPINVSEIQGVLDDVPETDVITDVLLFAADPATGKRTERALQRFPIEPDELPLSYIHQVFVDGAGED